MRLARAIGVIGLCCVASLGCAGRADYTPKTYVVRSQDTLYSIAWRHDLDYRELARWNGIGSDYRIAVGQILMLEPGARSRVTASGAGAPIAPSGPSAPIASGAPSTPITSSSPHAPRVDAVRVGAPQTMPAGPGAAPAIAGKPRAPPVAAPGAGPAPARGAASAGSVDPALWNWPTAHAGAPRPVAGGGILLMGELGQPIRAACSGRVVYAGNGIRGYGNLIIIKHGDNLLSAYAHTRELDVREGQDVLGGQTIAQMGAGPHQIAALYFEIRLNGKPVDPLPYLASAK